MQTSFYGWEEGKGTGKFISIRTIKVQASVGVELQLHFFLTQSSDIRECSATCSRCFIPRKRNRCPLNRMLKVQVYKILLPLKGRASLAVQLLTVTIPNTLPGLSQKEDLSGSIVYFKILSIIKNVQRQTFGQYLIIKFELRVSLRSPFPTPAKDIKCSRRSGRDVNRIYPE